LIKDKPSFGTIINEENNVTKLDVEVTQWWLKGGDKKYMPKEVRVPDELLYFRETPAKGWRRYNKLTVPKYNDTN
jgi:hypothetical protein